MDIDSIKRKLLIKYPIFGTTIVNLKMQPTDDIPTAATDGKSIFYNPTFIDSLAKNQQIFIFAHEICHVAFNHIYRREGKDAMLWNIATDSVINALLKHDGLPIIEGGVDIPEAINYDAEEMYELLKQDSNLRNQISRNYTNQDVHNMWDKAIEERKKGKSSDEKDPKGSNLQDNDSSQNNRQNQKNDKEKQDKKNETENEEQDERKAFRQNEKERKKRLKEFSEKLAEESSQKPKITSRKENSSLSRKVTDIGIALPLIDWRRLLKQAIKCDEDYTRKNARMRGEYFRHRIQQMPKAETEILIDTSGSVSEKLLKNFLRECKNIVNSSKVKVGCFDKSFYGFTDIRTQDDIDKLEFPGGGGTDFSVAVNAFSKNASNKIIFTDGYADMPKRNTRGTVWIVYGKEKIHPEGGRVIYISDEQLRKLNHSYKKHENPKTR